MPRASRLLPLLLATLALIPLSGSCAESGDECAINSDCDHAQCVSGKCVSECRFDTDCSFGLVCNTSIGRCDPPSDAGTGGIGPDGSVGGTGGGVSGSGGTQSGGAGGASGAGAGGGSSGASGGAPSGGGTGGATSTKLALDPCAGDAECKSGLLCRPFGKSFGKRCTPPCNGVGVDSACPSGTRCEAIGSEQYCMLSDIGKPCSQASDCQFACANTTHYCTGVCNTGADCPNGWGCMTVSGQNVCVKAAEPCDSSDTSKCIVPAACDTSPSLVVGGCTLACNSAADCPQRALGMSPWTCDGLCRRPASGATAIYGPLEGGYAPAQYACNASNQVVNVCGDSQHIDFSAFTIPAAPNVNCSSLVTTDGTAGDACVDSCRYQGGCPWGFLCTALGSIASNSRIGLCLPAGGGEVGAGCSKDADCFFGYCNRNVGKCSRDCSKDGLCPTGFSCVAAGGPNVEGLPFRRCE